MSAIEVDTTRLPLLLHELRLPAIARLWSEFADRTDKEGWPAARFLAALAELEIAERGRRRIVRHLAEAAGDAWLDKASNLLCFGPPGAAKSHLASAIGGALVENGYRVLFTRTTDIVQKLQAARQALQLEAAINRLDRYDLLILDDLCYVHKDHAETSVRPLAAITLDQARQQKPPCRWPSKCHQPSPASARPAVGDRSR
jgi:DNA replication protein DnaC